MGISNDDYSDIIKQKEENPQNALSTEDQELKQEMLDLIEILKTENTESHNSALVKLKKHCQTGSSNLTLLPKYLQFLHNEVDTLKEIHVKWTDYNPNSPLLCQIISALSILETETNDCLAYRLKSGPDDLSAWGLEYIRHLAEELKNDFETKLAKNVENTIYEKLFETALPLLVQITEFYMKNNCEIDAVDLYIDLDYQERLDEFINEKNINKISRYLQSCSYFFVKEDYLETNRFLYNFYLKFEYIIEAFYCALRCLDVEFFHDILLKSEDELLQKQMCYILGDFNVYYCFSEEHESEFLCAGLLETIHNKDLCKAHRDLAVEFDILKPTNIDDICRIGNVKYSSYYNSGNLKDPIYTVLASCFCSAFANTAFKTDSYLSNESKWLNINDTALMCCCACLGLLYLWDGIEAGLFLDKYINSSNVYVKSGGILGLGISNCHVHDEFMSNLAIFTEFMESEDILVRKSSIMGLGLSYAGTDDPDVLESLKDAFNMTDMTIKSCAALSIGMVAAGSNTPAHLVDPIIEYLTANKNSINLLDVNWRLIPVGLVMVYAGRYETIAHAVKEIGNLPGDFGKWCFLLVKIAGNFGTGHCSTISKLIEFIHNSKNVENEVEENEPEKDEQAKKKDMKRLKEETKCNEMIQGLATIGVALVCLIEEISQKMALKLFNTFLQFGSVAVRRAVPVALGILSASNPQINVIELLSKLSHDHDEIISLNAVIALGIVGAGTNNSRVDNLLRNLNVYHHNESLHVFAIRIAQGLCHLSKGTMSMTPLRAEGSFLSPTTLAAFLLHGVLSLDVKHTYLSKDPHMLFWLVPAMKFRGLITYDADGKSVPVTVRVGQAVDETGQAGKPKRITGFQTHRTPILLNVGERVELATNKYISYTPILESIVLVKQNPNAEEATDLF